VGQRQKGVPRLAARKSAAGPLKTRGYALDPPLAWLYTSFAGDRFSGNPAGVVVSSRPVAPEVAQFVAAVMSVPTTGFAVIDPDRPGEPVEAHFFTPEQEIDACGHVMVAMASALVGRGLWPKGSEVVVRARGGDFRLRLRHGQVEMDQQLRVLEAARVGWPDVEAALGPVPGCRDLPLAVAGTGLRHLMVPVAGMAALAQMAVDPARITGLAARAAVDTVCVFAAARAPGRYRVRDLCAAIGATEEPASGTTAGSLALYLARERQPAGGLVIEQGVEMGRPCLIGAHVRSSQEVTVRGKVRKVLSGVLELSAMTGTTDGRAPGEHR
jgi:trans-2,3-dihydro-3-hydroxyanthranilate isomerase